MTGYSDYLMLDELLALQQPRMADGQTELTFIVVHQVYELWFKLIIEYLESAVDSLDADEPLRGLRLLRKVHEVERLMIEQMTIIDHLDPGTFAELRQSLGTASAAESRQFALIEALSTKVGVNGQGTRPQDLWTAFCRHAGRAGLDMPAGEHPEAAARRQRTLNEIYRDGRSFQLELCEALLDHDQAFCVWRYRHAVAAARQIGANPGTGGSSGVSYLESRMGRRFYHELWAVRTTLDAPYGATSLR